MISLFKNWDVRTIVAAIVAVVLWRAISSLTGFGAWMEANSTASAIAHGFGILLFGGFGLFALLGGRGDPKMRTLGFRLTGILFLLFAVVHAVLLFSGAATFSDLVSE